MREDGQIGQRTFNCLAQKEARSGAGDRGHRGIGGAHRAPNPVEDLAQLLGGQIEMAGLLGILDGPLNGLLDGGIHEESRQFARRVQVRLD
jgi:hypothetical protein